MMAWRRKRTEKNKNKIYSNNRINIIIAIVFLLGGAILYQLFQIQVEKQDLYTAIASNQHQIFSELDPARGKIFMSDSEGESSAEEFSTLATNKEFALVYAIPKDIKDAEMTAENLYIVFKQKQVEEEVDKLLAKLTKQKLAEELAYVASLGLAEAERLKKENEVNNRYETLKYNKDHQEYLLIKREAEIKLRHDQIIEDYFNILNKRNDPYEPLEKKVDEETLIKFYSLMLNDKTITANDLEFKNGEIINKLAISDNNNIITLAGLGYAMITYRYYPENNIGSHLLGFVSQDSDEPRGKYGLEGFFDEELFGLYGSIKSEQGAEGQALIINDREYNPPVDGSNLILTINRSIQFTVCKKLNETALRHGADSGTIIVMEPNSGAIIAMCSWPDFDPNNYQEVDEIKVFNNPAIFEQYEPGSVFKAITMAA
ncbi:MAG: penicillin-binding transpeptidase domain-containing protein, partial [Patescibacteria group bacterium]